MHDFRHRTARPGLLICALAACGDNGGGDAETNVASEMKTSQQTAFEHCRSQCELAAGTCEEKPLSAFGGFEETLAEWKLRCPVAPATRPFLIVGTCADGTTLLQTMGKFTSERRYYADDGTFVALTTMTDVADQVCRGRGYWPEPFECEEARVTEVICGTSPWPVGAEI